MLRNGELIRAWLVAAAIASAVMLGTWSAWAAGQHEPAAPPTTTVIAASTTTTVSPTSTVVATTLAPSTTTTTTTIAATATTQATTTTTTTSPPPTTTTTSPPPPATTTTAVSPSTTTTAPQPPATTTTVAAYPAPSGDEGTFVALINELRGGVGLEALTVDPGLSSYARNWALTMASTGDFHHSDIGTLLNPWQTVGENIAWGYSAPSMFDGLTGSPGHYANMTNGSFTHLGVGSYVDASGRIWTAHVFGG